jgi:drug/metabolite transporter (DMT)-like permease
MPREHRLRLLLAFAAVYVIWGSTYLAIRVAIDTIPPFLMAGSRFLVAGGLLYAWGVARGAKGPTPAQWRTAAIVGGLLLLGGNGGVVWAEQRVASGLTALIIACEPLVVVLLDWARPGGRRPSLPVALGLVTGAAGMVLLITPGEIVGSGAVDSLGAGVLLVAVVSWAVGSIYSRHADAASSPLVSTGANMLAGSAWLFLAALLAGEPSRLEIARISARSAAALGYLITFGAIVGFTAYLWLLRNTTLARASTYAFVNPVVAVFLGWLLLREPVTARTVLAAVVIVAGVVLITAFQQAAPAPAPRAARTSGATTLGTAVASEPQAS